MPPLRVEVGLVGQAALHHVAAVVGAGPGGRHAPAVGAVGHPHHGPHALQTQLHLWTPDTGVSITALWQQQQCFVGPFVNSTVKALDGWRERERERETIYGSLVGPYGVFTSVFYAINTVPALAGGSHRFPDEAAGLAFSTKTRGQSE